MNTTVIPYFGETMALSAAVFWALAVILFKKSGETIHPLGLNMFKNLLAAVLFIPTLYLFGESLIIDVELKKYAVVILSGMLGIGIADTLFFHCLNRLGAGLTAVVDCFYAPSMILMSILFLSESMVTMQVIGVIMIISAILTAAHPKASSHLKRKDLYLGILFGALAMIIMAVGIVIVKPILDTEPFFWVTIWRLFGGIMILLPLLLTHRKRKEIIASVKNPHSKLTLYSGSILGAYLSMVVWLAGMKFASISTASALNQTNNIFIFIFAALILKEKINFQKTIGIVLAVAGAFLVTFA